MFEIPSSAFQIQVNCSFTVDNGQTIRVYVMNKTTFESSVFYGTTDNHPPTYYNGEASADDFNTTLAPGDTYYLVFNNSARTYDKNPSSNGQDHNRTSYTGLLLHITRLLSAKS